MNFNYDYLVVGCGISGVTIAERISTKLKKKVLIIDKRNHIAGNCYDYIDDKTNILLNKYGAHLFHTNNERVWNYVNSFCKWERWEHEVLSYVDNKLVPIPVNITTINKLLNLNIHNSIELEEWLANNQIIYDKINNSEEMAKSRIGEDLYNKLVKNYTFKQWNKFPNQLDKKVLSRIPVRKNFDTRYFDDKYQALPKNGYTNFVKNMIQNEYINLMLNVDFFEFKNKYDISKIPIIYTGPIDLYFKDKGLESLEYRSIDFKIERYFDMNYYQPNSVVNYPELNYKFTRIVEYKHFLNQKSPHTIIVSETTNDVGEPYYPVLTKKNLDLFEKYRLMSEKENNVYFVGRLANYKYFNMDQAILNSLEFFDKYLDN